MQKCLLFLLLLLSNTLLAQRGMLFIKKNGIKKVHTIAEGDPIRFQRTDNIYVSGFLWLVQNDSIIVDGTSHPVSSIKRIILRERNNSLVKYSLLTAGGILITSSFMAIANWAGFKQALVHNSVLGAGNILVREMTRIKRKQYRIGKRFSIQAIDLHF